MQNSRQKPGEPPILSGSANWRRGEELARASYFASKFKSVTKITNVVF
jgi:hypothetical protein